MVPLAAAESSWLDLTLPIFPLLSVLPGHCQLLPLLSPPLWQELWWLLRAARVWLCCVRGSLVAGLELCTPLGDPSPAPAQQEDTVPSALETHSGDGLPAAEERVERWHLGSRLWLCCAALPAWPQHAVRVPGVEQRWERGQALPLISPLHPVPFCQFLPSGSSGCIVPSHGWC